MRCSVAVILWYGPTASTMRWLRLVGSLKLQVSFAKEPYKRDDFLQKRPIILRSLRIETTPYTDWVLSHAWKSHVTHMWSITPSHRGCRVVHDSHTQCLHTHTFKWMCDIQMNVNTAYLTDISRSVTLRHAATNYNILQHSATNCNTQ